MSVSPPLALPLVSCQSPTSPTTGSTFANFMERLSLPAVAPRSNLLETVLALSGWDPSEDLTLFATVLTLLGSYFTALSAGGARDDWYDGLLHETQSGLLPGLIATQYCSTSTARLTSPLPPSPPASPFVNALIFAMSDGCCERFLEHRSRALVDSVALHLQVPPPPP